MRKTYYLYTPIITLFFISIYYFFNFTAEDAYITYRYAENLVTAGTLTFNINEPINALTSPLHALFSSVLFYITGHTVVANKLAGLFFLIVSSFLIWNRFKHYPKLQLLVLLLVPLSSSVLLWTFGGLETPLLLFLATTTTIIVERNKATLFSLKTLCLAFFLAGLGFLARYDSILFFAPILLYTSIRARSLWHLLIALTAGATLPILWLSISIIYYGDIFPTSFYIKTPQVGFYTFFKNSVYIGVYLFYSGLIPTMILAYVLLKIENGSLQILLHNIKSMWWLYTGILLQILYGLTMATTHMMFTFRYFVPYIPSAVLLISITLQHLFFTGNNKNSGMIWHSKKGTEIFNVFILSLLLFMCFQVAYTYNFSINVIGEYRKLSIQNYGIFIDILRKQSESIQDHWKSVQNDKTRLPRMNTRTAGMLPYEFKDSYVYSSLVSYRHNNFGYNASKYKPSSDYIHIITPRHGTVKQQLPMPPEKYLLISSYQMNFDGHNENFFVYFNFNPEPHTLSKKINE